MSYPKTYMELLFYDLTLNNIVDSTNTPYAEGSNIPCDVRKINPSSSAPSLDG